MHNSNLFFGYIYDTNQNFVVTAATITEAHAAIVALAEGRGVNTQCDTDGCCFIADGGANHLAAIQAEYPAETVFCAACEVAPVWFDGGEMCRKCVIDLTEAGNGGNAFDFEGEMLALRNAIDAQREQALQDAADRLPEMFVEMRTGRVICW
jgi:hypothetical protein